LPLHKLDHLRIRQARRSRLSVFLLENIFQPGNIFQPLSTTNHDSRKFPKVLPPDRRLPEIWNIVLSRRRRRARAIV
jgi:hypothetical protein